MSHIRATIYLIVSSVLTSQNVQQLVVKFVCLVSFFFRGNIPSSFHLQRQGVQFNHCYISKLPETLTYNGLRWIEFALNDASSLGSCLCIPDIKFN